MISARDLTWFWLLCYDRVLNSTQIVFAFVFLNCIMEPKAKICSVEETRNPKKYGLLAKPTWIGGGKPTGSSLSLGVFGQPVH